MKKIPFNRPSFVGNELAYIKKTVEYGRTSGDGYFTEQCHEWLSDKLHGKKVLLTTSGTHALELSALLTDLKPGDEVILPTYTFYSTANAIMLRGAKVIFVDIRWDTKNMDERLIESKITKRTKAIIPVHYAGVGCEMDAIGALAKKYHLKVIEDAAHAVGAQYKGQYLGTFGDLGCLSFHDTKNITAGECGALVVNDNALINRALILRDKGTNRSEFLSGKIQQYTWLDIGSSYLPSDMIAAVLYAQLKKFDQIIAKRKRIYEAYLNEFQFFNKMGIAELPEIPKHCKSNYHIFALLFHNRNDRTDLMNFLKSKGISTTLHYIPLHMTPIGEKLGYKKGEFPVTERVNESILRFPLFYDLSHSELAYILKQIRLYRKNLMPQKKKTRKTLLSTI